MRKNHSRAVCEFRVSSRVAETRGLDCCASAVSRLRETLNVQLSAKFLHLNFVMNVTY